MAEVIQGMALAVTKVEAEVVIPGEMVMQVVMVEVLVAAGRTTRALPKRTSLAWAMATGR